MDIYTLILEYDLSSSPYIYDRLNTYIAQGEQFFHLILLSIAVIFTSQNAIEIAMLASL